MRVAVEIGFVQSCPDCRAVVSTLSAAAIADPTVTRFAAVPGRKHAHEVTEGVQALPGMAATVKAEAALPPSDTNAASEAELEAGRMFSDAEMGQVDTMNGFDPPGRG